MINDYLVYIIAVVIFPWKNVQCVALRILTNKIQKAKLDNSRDKTLNTHKNRNNLYVLENFK